MKITQFTSNNLDALRADINAALRQISEKHGIDMSIGTMSYSMHRTTCRITMETRQTAIVGATGSIVPKGASYLSMYGLPQDAFERTFILENQEFKLTELKSSRPKNPCSIQRVKDGKQFRCSARTIIYALSE